MKEYADDHLEIKAKMLEMADKSKSFDDFLKLIKHSSLPRKKYIVANFQTVAVYTGPADEYRIVGCLAKYKHGRVVITDIYRK